MMNDLSFLNEDLNDSLKLLPGWELPAQPGLFSAADVIPSSVALGSRGKVDGVGYVLGGVTFRTKEAALAHMMQIRTKYPVGSFVSHDDARFIVDVVHTHCDAEEKVGHGITAVYIAACPINFDKKIMFFRLDGSTDDVGKKYVLGGKRDQHEVAVMQAMRNAVRPSIEAFRDAAYAGGATPLCGITGLPVPRDLCNVDHAPPMLFSEICWKAATLPGEGWKAYDVEKDAAGYFRLADDACREWFIQYHDAHAKLRITLKDANQRAGRHDVQNVQKVEAKLNRSAEGEARVQEQWGRLRQALFFVSTPARLDARREMIDGARDPLTSAISGKPLTPASVAAVFAIEKSLDMLMLEWLGWMDLNVFDVELVAATGGGWRVAKAELADSFADFLRDCASFIPVSKSEASAVGAPVSWVSIRQLVPC